MIADAARPSSESPTLSVVVPLVDDRDNAGPCLDGWLTQAAGGRDTEIVLVTDDHHPQVARLRARLRTQDRVVSCSSREEIAFYVAGARAARGRLLLFTESHCIPASDAALRLRVFFGQRRGCAGWLESDCVASNAWSRMEAHLYDTEKRHRRDPDDWRHVSLRGFAVTRADFERAGGFDAAFGRFAESVLARRLQQMGVRLVAVPGPLVRHVNCTSFRELATALVHHALGQAAHRERCEMGLAEQILPRSEVWSRRTEWSRRYAAEALRILALSLRLERGRPNWAARAGAALHPLPRLVAAVAFGAPGALLGARLAARLAAFRFLLALGGERRFAAYVQVWTALLAIGLLRYTAARPIIAAPRLGIGAPLRPAEVPDGALLGFHAPDRWGAETCRWTRPWALVRIALEPADLRFRLHLRSPVPPERRCLSIYFDGRPVRDSARNEDDHQLVFDIRREAFRPGPEHTLGLVCAPYRPAKDGLPDQRELGVALFSIAVELV
jgi:hypothetical protein